MIYEKNKDEQELLLRQNLEKIFNLPFILKYGGVFLEFKNSNLSKIGALVEKYGLEDAQKYWNHIHLGGYESSLGTQRVLAWEVIDKFRQRAKIEYSINVPMIAEIKDDEYEIEVTLWAGGMVSDAADGHDE